MSKRFNYIFIKVLMDIKEFFDIYFTKVFKNA